MADDNTTDPGQPGHLPVSGEFDADNPLPDDSAPLNTDSYETSPEDNDPEDTIIPPS
jgi:hypothetical protein